MSGPTAGLSLSAAAGSAIVVFDFATDAIEDRTGAHPLTRSCDRLRCRCDLGAAMSMAELLQQPHKLLACNTVRYSSGIFALISGYLDNSGRPLGWFGHDAEQMRSMFGDHPWPEGDHSQEVLWKAERVVLPMDEEMTFSPIAHPTVLAAFDATVDSVTNTVAYRVLGGQVQVCVRATICSLIVCWLLQICDQVFTFGGGTQSDVYVPRVLFPTAQETFTSVCRESVQALGRKRARNVTTGCIRQAGDGKSKAERIYKSTYRQLGGVLWGLQHSGQATVKIVGKRLVLGEKFDQLVDDPSCLEGKSGNETMKLDKKQVVQHIAKGNSVRLVTTATHN